MTKTKHTPAPWFIKEATKLYHIHGGDPNCSSLVVVGVRNESDACLIAAAPELLEALEDLVNSPNAKENLMWDKARLVIKKAKGNNYCPQCKAFGVQTVVRESQEICDHCPRSNAIDREKAGVND